ncbi:MAG: sugar ABC transporter substrate-binding protein [Candidatus Coatesbacteria bacterium]
MRRHLVRVSVLSALLAAGASAKDLRIAVVPPGLISPFHVQVDQGAQAACARLKLTLLHPAPPRETDFAEQVRIVEDLITQHVDAISVCAIGNEAIVPAVKKANKAGIPFFIHNSLEPLPAGEVTAYIGYNQRKGARLMGEYAVRLLKGRGKVLILEGIPGYHTRERTAGFREGLDVERNRGIVVVGSQPADWERSKAMAVTENSLQRVPDLTLVFGCSDEMALGAAAAAKAHHRPGMFFLGIDGNPNAIDAIRKGEMTATLGVYPRRMGAMAVETILKALKGRRVPRIVETPMEIVTVANAEAYLKKQ